MRRKVLTPEQQERELRKSRLVDRVGDLEAAKRQIQQRFEAHVRPLVIVRNTELDPIEREERAIIDELAALVEADLGDKSSITQHLPSGDVSLSISGDALVITDEKAFMALARQWRMVRQVSVPKPRELQKTPIKAALKNSPWFFAKVSHLLKQPKTTTLTVRPASFEGEVKVETRKVTVPYPPPKVDGEQTTLF